MIDTRELIEELRNLELEEEEDLTEEDRERMDVINDVLDEIGNDAQDGVALIPEDEFEEYAQQLAEDIGAINDDTAWPCTCIDWERAARELSMDYDCITFDGADYLYRA